jgi:hypothetical protein
MQNTRPARYRVAYILLLPHNETERIVTGMVSSPTRLCTTSTANGSSTSHSFQVRTIRTRHRPMPPMVAPGCSTQ